MSLGEVDTLNLLAEKLDNLFKDSQGYYESFLDANTMYKQGKLSDKEFFEKLGDYTVAYSALEFLAVKVIFELKKAIDRAGAGGLGGTQSPGLMPGMGSPGMGMGGMGMPGRVPVMPQTPGRPPSIVSAQQGFSNPGTLPSPDPMLMPRSSMQDGSGCRSCGAELRPGAKFCTKCGNKV
ncbi:MAG: zinc-ribbon domain-containing protein [Nitrososphaeria archaeon]|nr:zinc-ribbon domain-containing protein [Nitrososphaeria archaeon]NDB50906.1 zinc-ribbon domain-containing protein [Nitrosopumilaceae archaeon]NDB88709.1 zinc-ribbon domain-containing protein [Nitrososphaerota archaeon]NDB46305.1 zinc-ribbon domain-containing protein [Nitrososphaeria archaeon]NDB89836.1 zinc-ribbon domain-containing protein [Nitrososphaerota archaeon]